MRNAPWKSDDKEILREKWRLANETASLCELLLQKIEILKIRVDHVQEGSTEYEARHVEGRELIIAIGQQLIESGLTMKDWVWFVNNRIPDESERWVELFQLCQQSEKLQDLFYRLKQFVEAVSKAKRQFASAIQLVLNDYKDTENPNTSWFQVVDDGVRIHGRLVEVRGRDADVLGYLCERTNRPSTYYDIAELSETWRKGLDGKPEKTERSTKSSIRTSLNKIRKAIRKSFELPDNYEPVPKCKNVPGWKLDKASLSEIAPLG